MSDKASLSLIKERIDKLENEALRDSQENEYLMEKVMLLRSRIHQIMKALKSKS